MTQSKRVSEAEHEAFVERLFGNEINDGELREPFRTVRAEVSSEAYARASAGAWVEANRKRRGYAIT